MGAQHCRVSVIMHGCPLDFHESVCGLVEVSSNGLMTPYSQPAQAKAVEAKIRWAAPVKGGGDAKQERLERKILHAVLGLVLPTSTNAIRRLLQVERSGITASSK